MHQPVTYVNGKYVPACDAVIPVSSRAARFGDGVFETIRLVRTVPYQWHAHMTRMQAGLAALHIPLPAIDFQAVAREVLTRNYVQDGYLRISVARGGHSRGYMPVDTETAPDCWVEYIPASNDGATPPLRVWLSKRQRPSRDTGPVHCKLSQGISSTLALIEAAAHQCDEALLLDSKGMLCSAAAANLFWVREQMLYTPSLSTGCLAGSTREAILRVSPLPITQCDALPSALQQAEVVFLSNVRLGIQLVRVLEPLGWKWEISHPAVIQMIDALHKDKEEYYSEYSNAWKFNP